MKNIVLNIIRFRWVIITLVFAITLVLGYQIKYLTINSDILSTLPDDDPTARLYKDIGDQFGGNDIGMIVLETDDVFKTEVLEHIKQVTDSLKITPGVSSVTSLTNILDIRSSDWGIEIGKLIDEYNMPDNKQALDSLRRYVFSKDMYKGAIVSEDGSATIILFTLLPDADMQSVAMGIKQTVENMHLPERLYYGGLPFMLNDVSALIMSDMLWLIPIVFVIIAGILLISFKSLSGMILPLLTAGITVIWTLGIMALTGYEITIISNIIPVILLAIASAYTIHVLNSIHLTHLDDSREALVNAMEKTMVPVTLAAITTGIGFISFVFGAYLTMIKDFGIISSYGIIIALVLSVFFIPSVIAVVSKDQNTKAQAEKHRNNVLIHSVLQPLSSFLFKHPKTVLSVWVVVLAISIGGIFLIRTSVNITEYFKKDNPTRVSEDVLQQKFGGSLPVFVEFTGDMQDPDVLKTMIKTEHFMEEDKNIYSTNSVADLVEQMNDAMGEGVNIPDEKAKIEQLWFLLDGQEVMPQLVSDDLDRGIIQSKFASIETRAIDDFTNKMNNFIKENSSDKVKITFTGIPPLYVQLNNSLIKSQYSSLIIAIAMVLLIVAVIMRSFAKGVYATIPIIATILILLGFMGFAGISLDIATVLVGSIALGIGIDYSIHMISGINGYMGDYKNIDQAIEQTIITKGKAVIINVVSVAAGFIVLLFAQMLPIQNFGLLIAISMFGSGLGALTLLPVILILVNRRHTLENSNQSK